MGADNQPVDIMGESSLATINAEMNEAIVTIVVEGNRKAQMQALQGQMLASMGAVRLEVELTSMIGIGDPITTRPKSTEPGYVQADIFKNVNNKSWIKFNNLSHADKIEILDEAGNLLYNVKGSDRQNVDYGGETYFKHGQRVNMGDVFKSTGPHSTIQIRVTGNPYKDSYWIYYFYGGTHGGMLEVPPPCINIPCDRD